MLSGEFARKLRQLNRNLHIYCGDSDSRPAGVYFYKGYGEYDSICGISKNFVPEFSELSPQGMIIRGGWRRVLDILLTRKLIDRKKTEEVFGFHFDTRQKPPKQKIEMDAWQRQWKEAQEAGRRESIRKFGIEEEGYMRWQDVADIARMKKKQRGEL